MKPIEEPECPECRKWKITCAMYEHASEEAAKDNWILVCALSAVIGALVALLIA